jgi:hypothetical protein
MQRRVHREGQAKKRKPDEKDDFRVRAIREIQDCRERNRNRRQDQRPKANRG